MHKPDGWHNKRPWFVYVKQLAVMATRHTAVLSNISPCQNIYFNCRALSRRQDVTRYYQTASRCALQVRQGNGLVCQ